MRDVNILTSAGVNVQASLELLGDMEMYNDTLTDFLDMVEERKNKLNNFLASNDMPNYAIEVHALKSDSRYLGFLELGDLAYDSEMKSKAGDTAGVTANHPIIMEKLQNMINVSNAYLGKTEGSQVQQPVNEPTIQPTMTQPVQQPVQTPNMMNQGYGMPVQPVQQPIMQQPVQTGAIYDLTTGTFESPTMTQPVQQPVMQQPAQTGAIYDLTTGTFESPAMTQPVQQPVMQQPTMQPMNTQSFDPMSQALYNQQQNEFYQMQATMRPNDVVIKQGTILVVDDSNLVANFVKKIFDANYEVVIANDGAKAIELCADDTFRSKIKACLLDLNMPNVDGYQVLEDFYKKGYFVKMPIAVISGVEDTESIDRVNKYPIIDILAKPFNERDVQRVVEKCLAAYF